MYFWGSVDGISAEEERDAVSTLRTQKSITSADTSFLTGPFRGCAFCEVVEWESLPSDMVDRGSSVFCRMACARDDHIRHDSAKKGRGWSSAEIMKARRRRDGAGFILRYAVKCCLHGVLNVSCRAGSRNGGRLRFRITDAYRSRLSRARFSPVSRLLAKAFRKEAAAGTLAGVGFPAWAKCRHKESTSPWYISGIWLRYRLLNVTVSPS